MMFGSKRREARCLHAPPLAQEKSCAFFIGEPRLFDFVLCLEGGLVMGHGVRLWNPHPLKVPQIEERILGKGMRSWDEKE
jgi:hypothetical protein